MSCSDNYFASMLMTVFPSMHHLRMRRSLMMVTCIIVSDIRTTTAARIAHQQARAVRDILRHWLHVLLDVCADICMQAGLAHATLAGQGLNAKLQVRSGYYWVDWMCLM